MNLLPNALPGLLSPPLVVGDHDMRNAKSWLSNLFGGAAAGSGAGPWGAGVGAVAGLVGSFIGAGYQANGGGEIRRQLSTEDPNMVAWIVAWAQQNRPDWYNGTGNVWEGNGELLHQLEDEWRHQQALASGNAPEQLAQKQAISTVLWFIGGLLGIGLIVFTVRKLRKK